MALLQDYLTWLMHVALLKESLYSTDAYGGVYKSISDEMIMDADAVCVRELKQETLDFNLGSFIDRSGFALVFAVFGHQSVHAAVTIFTRPSL